MLMDVASSLRGLGVRTKAYGDVVPLPNATDYMSPRHKKKLGHCKALSDIGRQPRVTDGRPGASGDPRGVHHSRVTATTAWMPCVHDDRDFLEVVGASTRAHGRWEF